jgi:hypothetical protein
MRSNIFPPPQPFPAAKVEVREPAVCWVAVAFSCTELPAQMVLVEAETVIVGIGFTVMEVEAHAALNCPLLKFLAK